MQSRSISTPASAATPNGSTGAIRILGHAFSYLGTDHGRSRWGIDVEFELGLNCTFEDGNHFGIRAGYTVAGSTLKKDLNLPAALYANDKRH